MIKNKNLLDIEKTIQNEIIYIENHNETITSIEMNKYTQDYLKSKNIHSFKSHVSGNISIIINNMIPNLELKINREKNIKSTEYEPYEMKRGDMNMNIKGETKQNGAPTPENLVEIENEINILLATEILNKLKSKVTLVKSDEKEYRLPFLTNIEQQAIETVLNELKKRDEIIKTLQEIKKEALLDDLGKQYNIYKHIDSTKCLHCGENIPHYCEKCYQQLISDISKYQGG